MAASFKITSVENIVSARKPSLFPKAGEPEFVFVGRSNVGKSSLLNHLLRNRRIAGVSKTPGKTRSINFYRINERFLFVDLPGYGYAKLPPSVVSSWKYLIEAYLDRQSLAVTFVLVDIRHQPSKGDDSIVDWLRHYEKDFVIVATKSDKLSRSRVIQNVARLESYFGMTGEKRVIPFSVKDGVGRDGVWSIILSRLR